MPIWLRNTLAVVAGIVAGSIVNMGLITIGPSLIPPPAGVDTSTIEGLRAGMHLYEWHDFITPFVAHAAGAFVGALVTYLIATMHRARFAYGIGAFFLVGGIAASFMLPAPVWFVAVDLLVAYIPMAWLATRVGPRFLASSEQRTAN